MGFQPILKHWENPIFTENGHPVLSTKKKDLPK
jgi:hypothetical protein